MKQRGDISFFVSLPLACKVAMYVWSCCSVAVIVTVLYCIVELLKHVTSIEILSIEVFFFMDLCTIKEVNAAMNDGGGDATMFVFAELCMSTNGFEQAHSVMEAEHLQRAGLVFLLVASIGRNWECDDQ